MNSMPTTAILSNNVSNVGGNFRWGSSKARDVLKALKKMGWTETHASGSHKSLARDGWSNFSFAFHANEELGPKMLSRISKFTGLTPRHL